MMNALVSRLRSESTSQTAPHTENAASLIFAVYLRAAALACYELELPFAAYPYKLVKLLCPHSDDEARQAQWEEDAAVFLTCPPCCLDAFSAQFQSTFPTWISIQSLECQQMLEALFLEVDCTTYSTERAHSSNARRVRTRTSTHQLTLAQTALCQAEAVPHACHRFQSLQQGHTGHKRKRAFVADHNVEEDEEACKSKGYGGAWRAFLHCRAQGPGRKSFSTLAENYRELSPESHRHYEELGKEATVLRRNYGLSRAFPCLWSSC